MSWRCYAGMLAGRGWPVPIARCSRRSAAQRREQFGRTSRSTGHTAALAPSASSPPLDVRTAEGGAAAARAFAASADPAARSREPALGAKFSHAFDLVFRSEDISVIRTPIQAPNANAHAERWVRTLRAVCLDRILILGRRQLEHVLRVYRQRYNEHRPHRRLRLSRPTAATRRPYKRLPAYTVATSSVGSSTNTGPPEFANPTRSPIALN
jgi:Integrase core domain